MTSTVVTEPSNPIRVLGTLGILGGLALLAAYIGDIPSDANVVRISLYAVGAMSVIVAVVRRAGPIAPAIARLLAVAAVAAYGLFLARLLLPYTSWHPFAGDDGLTLFAAGVAMWLTTSAFGLATARYRLAIRMSATLLAIASLSAMTGIDRLALTSAAEPTIFGPLSQVGIVLTGVAWILLGVELVVRSSVTPTTGTVGDRRVAPGVTLTI